MASANHTSTQTTFKPVDRFPNWMVGTDGSLLASDEYGWYPVRPKHTTEGYQHVRLSYAGVTRHVSVHVLVLETFVGPRPPGMVGCHAPDYSPANNRLENLRWDTNRENARDCKRHGFRRFNEKPRKKPRGKPLGPRKRPPAAAVAAFLRNQHDPAEPGRCHRASESEARDIVSAYIAGIVAGVIARSQGFHEDAVWSVLASDLGIGKVMSYPIYMEIYGNNRRDRDGDGGAEA